jgi:HEAT repeat protein
MKKYLVLPMLFAGAFALPCAAEFKDAAAAKAALGSSAEKDRLDAIHFLGAQRTQAACETLAGHFKQEKDPYLRMQLVQALDVHVSTWATSCVIAAADDSNQYVKQAAIVSLSRLRGNAAAEKKMKDLTADPSEVVRITVVNALSVNTSTTSVAIVSGVLADKKGTLKARRAAAGVLSRMATPEADKELLKHVSDADPEIKAAAVSRKPSKAKPAKKK